MPVSTVQKCSTGQGSVYHQKLATLIWITFNDSAFYLLKIIMIVRPQQHWIRLIFVWHGSVLSKIFSRLLLNFLLSIAIIIMLPWYTMLGIKFTLAPFSILGVAIAIFWGFAIMPVMRVTSKRDICGGS